MLLFLVTRCTVATFRKQLVRQLDLDYCRKFDADPAKDRSLVYFLGDRYEWSRTWSAISKSIPTFRKQGGKFLCRGDMKFLTGLDKLASLGWPVHWETATQMGTTPVPALEPRRTDMLVGNAMHLSCASVVLMLGLTCFGAK